MDNKAHLISFNGGHSMKQVTTGERLNTINSRKLLKNNCVKWDDSFTGGSSAEWSQAGIDTRSYNRIIEGTFRKVG
jgi:hypothetical protein